MPTRAVVTDFENLKEIKEELEELMRKLERAEEEKILIDAEVNSIRSSKDAAQMAGTC